jgi:Zn-dependent protease with chaperone function
MENPAAIKIMEISRELKLKNLIDPGRAIKSKKMSFPYRAGIFASNTISFNPAFSMDLDDDMIRFCLLHEEGHLKRGQYGVPALMLLIGIGIFPVIHCIVAGIGDGILVVSLGFMLFVLVSSMRILTEPFRWDEYGSDEFATRILHDTYGITKPSLIVGDTLDRLPSGLDVSKLLPRLIYALIEIHPTAEERVRHIVGKIDDK